MEPLVSHTSYSLLIPIGMTWWRSTEIGVDSQFSAMCLLVHGHTSGNCPGYLSLARQCPVSRCEWWSSNMKDGMVSLHLNTSDVNRQVVLNYSLWLTQLSFSPHVPIFLSLHSVSMGTSCPWWENPRYVHLCLYHLSSVVVFARVF